MRKKKIDKQDESLYIDGKLDKPKPKTINEVLGIQEHRYATNNRDEYQESLKAMTLWELHRHALEDVGVRPNSDRRRMTRTLVEEFDKHQRVVNASQAPAPKQPKMTKELERLLNSY